MKTKVKLISKSMIIIGILLLLITSNIKVLSDVTNIEPGLTYENGVQVRQWPAEYIPMTEGERSEAITLINKFHQATIDDPLTSIDTFYSDSDKKLINRYIEYCELRYIPQLSESGLIEPDSKK